MSPQLVVLLTGSDKWIDGNIYPVYTKARGSSLSDRCSARIASRDDRVTLEARRARVRESIVEVEDLMGYDDDNEIMTRWPMRRRQRDEGTAGSISLSIAGMLLLTTLHYDLCGAKYCQ